MPPKRTGLSRLWRYTAGRHGRIAVVLVLAAVSAVAPVVGWHLVRDAVDNGIRGHNQTRLAIDVFACIN